MIFFIVVAVITTIAFQSYFYCVDGCFDWAQLFGSVVAGLVFSVCITIPSLAITFSMAPTQEVTKEYDLHSIYKTSEVYVEAKENRYNVRVDEGIRSVSSGTATIMSTMGEIEPKLVYTENYITSNWWTYSLGIVGKSESTSSVIYIDKDTLVVNDADEGKSAQLLEIK